MRALAPERKEQTLCAERTNPSPNLSPRECPVWRIRSWRLVVYIPDYVMLDFGTLNGTPEAARADG